MTQAEKPRFARLPVVAATMATILAVLGLRLTYLGTVAATDTSLSTPQFPLHAQRGSIWAQGGELLATEDYTYEVAVVPHEVVDAATFALVVAPHVGVPASAIESVLADQSQQWVSLAAEVPMSTARTLAAHELRGLHLQRQARRAYPLGADAAHVIGFVDTDGQGHYGIEGYYDDVLRGQDGSYAGNFGSDPRALQPARNGTDLILTLDRDIQLAAAQALRDAIELQDATAGSVLVMDPHTGAVLASVSWPSYDPSDYGHADTEAFRDPVVSDNYEPGSVLKAVTMAAAIDAGAVTPDSTYDDSGFVTVAGMSIHNWDSLPHGTTTMTQLLQHSLNVGAVHVARALGTDAFYASLAAFGLGSPTGIDLANEAHGLIHWPDREEDWFEGNIATNSFGQGLSATPMQVLATVAAVAAGGQLMQPHVVAARVQPDGTVVPNEPKMVRRVISAETARTVRQMLAEVVSGRVTQAAVPGYSVGGKTGTSQIPTPDGYDSEETIASFAGFVPVEDPRVVVLVKIDRAEGMRGSDVAAPVFRVVARAAIRALDIPPDVPIDPAGETP